MSRPRTWTDDQQRPPIDQLVDENIRLLQENIRLRRELDAYRDAFKALGDQFADIRDEAAAAWTFAMAASRDRTEGGDEWEGR